MGKMDTHWITNFFTGKKYHKEQQRPKTRPPSIPRATTPKGKRRWSFCRSPSVPASVFVERNMATGATTPAAVVVRGSMESNDSRKQATVVAANEAEDGAAIKIQAVFRAHLARRALKALKGLVRLQALMRGILVRKQVRVTFRCMASLVTAQTRARAQRLMHVAHEEAESIVQSSFGPMKSTHQYKFRNLNEHNTSCSEHLETNIMETEHKISTPPSSTITSDHTSPRTCSNHFERYSSSPARTPFAYPRSEYGESSFYDLYSCPKYMANTESSRAKLRAHSVPKQRPLETLERLTGRRRFSLEIKNATVSVQRETRRLARPRAG